MLRTLTIDGIFDVGANRGQFTLACNISHSGTPIIAFEPIPSEASTFKRVHGNKANIQLHEIALGENKGDAELHLSGKKDSSSLLPIGQRQSQLFKGTGETGTITVQIATLDDFQEEFKDKNRLLLKLDVQGYELNVLRGAETTLRQCAYVYAECSEVALYDGQALRPEVDEFLFKHGFQAPTRYNEHYENGQLIQADYLYSKES